MLLGKVEGIAASPGIPNERGSRDVERIHKCKQRGVNRVQGIDAAIVGIFRKGSGIAITWRVNSIDRIVWRQSSDDITKAIDPGTTPRQKNHYVPYYFMQLLQWY